MILNKTKMSEPKLKKVVTPTVIVMPFLQARSKAASTKELK